MRLYDGPLMANEIAALAIGSDPFAEPTVSNFTLAGGTGGNQPTVTNSSVAGRIYHIETTTDLLNNPWELLAVPVVASSATTTFVLPVTGEPRRFYRVVETR